ncbi:MAG: hypothetical protein ACPG45_08790 [Flavobacteriaceae bacterium]
MSVKNIIIVLILVSMILFPSCKKEVNLQFDDVNEYGIHVFNLLKEKRHSQLKELIINKNDYDLLLNQSDFG